MSFRLDGQLRCPICQSSSRILAVPIPKGSHKNPNAYMQYFCSTPGSKTSKAEVHEWTSPLMSRSGYVYATKVGTVWGMGIGLGIWIISHFIVKFSELFMP